MVKRIVQRRNNMMMVEVELRSYNRDRCKSDPLARASAEKFPGGGGGNKKKKNEK